jgi:aerobic carbon-monoxide dehydrogenase large subunit
VVAESRALAEDAAELVEVDYEPLAPVVELAEARERLLEFGRSGGDVEGAFAAAEAVVARRYVLPRMVTAPIEPRGAIAAADPETGALTVWCSAQDPHRPLSQLAHILRRDRSQIRVVIPAVGGAFGSKGVVGAEVATIAAAAPLVGRPLKWAEDRLENFLTAYQGRGLELELELALERSGRMLGLRGRIRADLGAYLITATPVPPHTAAMLICGCYAIEAAEIELIGLRTNKAPSGPSRGAGRPEAIYAIERLVDAAARELGIDRVELRRRNIVREFPHRTPLGWTYDSGDYERLLDRALELGARGPRSSPAPGRLAGRGVALLVERSGGQFEAAEAGLAGDGRIVIASSSSPHGQGHATTFAQIAADRLAVGVGEVELRFGDSAVVPAGVGTFASRSVAMGGSAIVVAVDELVAEARRLAATLLDAAEDELELRLGHFRAHGRGVSWRELAAACADPARRPEGFGERLRGAGRFQSELLFSSGAYLATVEIDPSTGGLAVTRLIAVDDPGTVINPLLAQGQVIGGAVHGLGECLVEEAVYDSDGQPRTASFADYSLLTAAEVPPIETADASVPTPLNPLGAKGIGEAGTIGTLAAVANAVDDALEGRGPDPPFSPRRIWEALADDPGRPTEVAGERREER